jgi:hypothetical protein
MFVTDLPPQKPYTRKKKKIHPRGPDWVVSLPRSGLLHELETQALIAEELGYLGEDAARQLEALSETAKC